MKKITKNRSLSSKPPVKNKSKIKSKPKTKSKTNFQQYLKSVEIKPDQLNVLVLGDLLGSQRSLILTSIVELLGTKWFKSSFEAKAAKEAFSVPSDKGHFFILSQHKKSLNENHLGRMDESDYAWHRDQAGVISQIFKQNQLKSINLHFVECTRESRHGLIVGFQLGSYQYKNFQMMLDSANSVLNQRIWTLPEAQLQKLGSVRSKSNNLKISDFLSSEYDKADLKNYFCEAFAVNVARHFVNTPPNFMNPESFVVQAIKLFAFKAGSLTVSAPKNIQKLLAGQKEIQFRTKPTSTDEIFVDVWDQERLKNENCGMILAVGQGSDTPPYLMRVRYRSQSSAPSSKPIALVGKGVTFDSGGYDIKPSSAMRLMKKDMGGAASVLGVCVWALMTKPNQNLDFYFGLAENMVDSSAFRPSDVITARNGMTVEIHNTDAEGRLVLGDAIDVAVTQMGSEEPQLIIDCATLTGACRVALGVEVAGLFSNHDRYCEMMESAAQSAGDPIWRLPLYQKYTANFGSNFADMVNATDGMGGAITAALFLEKFVRSKPWIHLDMYAWADRPQGALASAGGNGQGVQAIIEFIRKIQTTSAS